MKHLYYNSENILYLEKTDLLNVAHNSMTPFYIYGQSEIEKNCQEVISIAGNLEFTPCFALKANYNPHIIHLIHQKGFGADVVSGGELYFALQAGIPADKIVFAGVGKTDEEIIMAIEAGIHSIIIESESEFKVVKKYAEKLNKKTVISIRVNPDIDANTHPYISTGLHSNKFGVDQGRAVILFQKAAESTHIIPAGIHVHIGSQIDQVDPYLQTVKFLKQLTQQLSSKGIQINFIDLGGGIGIDYQNQLNPDGIPRTYINQILPDLLDPLRNFGKKILIELGRSIVGTAGLLITKVLYIKETPLKKFIIVDAAMNNLIRPSLYQAFHQIIPLKRSTNSKETVDIVGPVCETSDFFARDREMEKINEGDYLAITGSGAYGQSLASNYNLRPLITEYLVKDDHLSTIFKGETIHSIADKFSG